MKFLNPLIRLLLVSFLGVAWAVANDVPANAPEILYSGRRSEEGEGRVHLSYSGSRVRLAFKGERVSARLRATDRENFANIYVNGVRTGKILLPLQETSVRVAEGLDPEQLHTVEIVKATEGFAGEMVFSGFELSPGAEPRPWPHPETRNLLFIGDSIVCGYGIEAESAEDPFRNAEQNFCLTFAGRTARALRADYEVVARSGIGFHRNYNGPREGSADTLPVLFDRVHIRREQPVWDFTRFSPDVICINLGTNDFSTQGGDVESIVKAGAAFLKRMRDLYPTSRVLLVSGPLQNSEAYRNALREMLDQSGLPETETAIFTLSPQGQLGFGAHWHPSARQGERNALELTRFLSEWMEGVWGDDHETLSRP